MANNNDGLHQELGEIEKKNQYSVSLTCEPYKHKLEMLPWNPVLFKGQQSFQYEVPKLEVALYIT